MGEFPGGTVISRSAAIARYVCRFLGVVFVVLGPLTFLGGDTAQRYHDLLHFVTGLIALYIGFWRSRSAARLFCLIFGSGYLIFGVLGIALGDVRNDRMWHVGPLHLMLADHIFHVVLGTTVMLAGLVTSRTRSVERVRDAAR